MADFFLSWSPVNNQTSLEQNIQYKKDSDVSYTTVATVSPQTDSYLITGLDDNTLYDFRVSNTCSNGGPLFTLVVKGINLICPTLNVSTSTSGSIDYNFDTIVSDDVDKYLVEIYDEHGQIDNYNEYLSPFASNISDTFSNLDSSLEYTLKLKITIGDLEKDCGTTDFILPNCVVISDIIGEVA